MGVISVSLPSDGTSADVGDYNTPIQTIVNAINGNLDNANIAASAAIATSKLADDAGITGAKLATNAITLGYAQATSNFTTTSTTFTIVTGVTTTVTVPSGGRKVKITCQVGAIQINTVAGNYWALAIYKDGSPIQQVWRNQDTGSFNIPVMFFAVDTPTSGSHTYDLRTMTNVNTNTVTINANAGTSTSGAIAGPVSILVEAI